MSAPGRIRAWLRAIVSRGAMERDMLEEMTAHIEQATERFMARGMSRNDARLAARREFGQPGVIQEDARDARGGRWAESLRSDLRYAFRYFARTPLTTTTIVLTLMLGIGANAAMITVIEGLTMRPAPGVPNDPSLVFIQGTLRYGTKSRLTSRGMAFREIADYKALPQFNDVVAWQARDVVTTIGDGDAAIGTSHAQFVTPNYFDVAGIRLLMGPGFLHSTFGDIDDPDLSVILGYSVWKERFAGDPDVVGRRMKVNDVEVTIAGVAPRRFNGVQRSSAQRMLWLPVSTLRLMYPATSTDLAGYARGEGDFRAFARLRPGASIEEATSAARLVGGRAVTPARNFREPTTHVDPIATNFRTSNDDDIVLGGLFAGIGLLLLLVCCTNVSSLLVGAAVSRRQEIGVRLSMGASRRRIVQQLVTEVAILAMAGGALGLGFYWAGVAKFGHMLRDVDIAPDLSSAGGTAIIAMLTAVICGLSPALHATRLDLSSVLKDTTATATSRTRLQRIFVVAQIALTQPLLVGLATMMAMLFASIDARGTLPIAETILRLDLSTYPSTATPAAKRIAFANVQQRIEALPGVVGTIALPSGAMIREIVPQAGQRATSGEVVKSQLIPTSPRYFELHSIPLVRGREFGANDTPELLGFTPLIVDTDFAAEMWGPTNPLGQRFRSTSGKTLYEVIGVVDGEVAKGLPDSSVPRASGTTRVMFAPNTFGFSGALMIRTSVPAEPLIPTVRAIALAEARMMPIIAIHTLAQIERSARKELFQALGAAAAGGLLALFLGAIGLYAVVTLGVGQRRREIGIRIALGAAPTQVVRMFFGSGVRLGLVGLAIGLPLSVAALWIFSTQVGMPRINMMLIGTAVALSVLAVASLATWLPARQAASVDPMKVLKME